MAHEAELQPKPNLLDRALGVVRRNKPEAIVAGVSAVILLAGVLPSPYVVESPGPHVDVLGTIEVEGTEAPVLTVEGQVDDATDAELNLLTVYVSGNPENKRTWMSLVPALFDRSQSIHPLTDFYPEGITVEQRDEASTQQMASSQVQAEAAAFRAAGFEVNTTLTVAEVSENGPSEGLLEVDDVIVSVEGKPVKEFSQLTKAVSASSGAITVGVLRDGKTTDVSVTPRAPKSGADPLMGVVISTSFDIPRKVDISVPDIGGPSAGMIFGLAIMERLGKGPDLGDLTISGTGTLDPDGNVGAIGGLKQKAWAAKRANSDIFIMPMSNCVDVEDFPKDLNVAPVATLEEAVDVLNAVSAGKPYAGIERCAELSAP